MIMLKKLSFLLLLAMVSVIPAFAQEDDLPPPSSKPKEEKNEVQEMKKEDEDFKPFKKQKKVDLSKFIIEPNVNLSIVSNRIDVGVSPYVGYNVWKGLCVGGGVTYFYTGINNIEVTDQLGQPVGTAKAHFHTYGGGVFLQYNIWRGFFARVRFEVLERDLSDLNSPPLPNNPHNYSQGFHFARIQKTVPAMPIGIGYNLLQSKNFFFPIMISYDVLHSVVDPKYSLYPRGLIVQLGFVNVF